MTTVNPSKTSIATEIRSRLSGRSQMDGQAGTIVRKLLSGQRLSQIEKNIAAATGLGTAVVDLIGATGNAQANYSGLAGAKNTADVFLKSRNVLNKAAEADRLYAEQYKGYAKVSNAYHTSAVSKAAVATRPGRDMIIRTAGDVATVAGLGLSAAALPGLAKKVATSFSELGTLVHDPAATTDQRLDKVEELARASAGTVYSAQGVVMGVKGVANIASRAKPVAVGLEKLSTSPIARFVASPFGKALNVILPVADGAIFIGEAIATRRTLQDANATETQKARKVLDLSLAGLKTAFWIFPQVRFLRSIYTVAGLGQLGLTLWDMRKEMGPKLVSAAKTAAWGVAHPVQAAKNIGHAVGAAASKAAGWVWSKVSHPAETAKAFGAEVSAWYNALWSKSRSAVSSWFPGTQQPVVAAAPAVAPVAAPVAAPVTTAPAAPFLAEAPVAAPAAQPTTDAAYQAAAAQIAALG